MRGQRYLVGLSKLDTQQRQSVSRRTTLQRSAAHPHMTFNQVLKRVESKSDPVGVRGMARFGITAAKAYGWSTPALKKFAREIGKDHDLAQRLWSTGILEARMLAGLIDEKQKVSEMQMENWAKDFDSWAVCDGTCLNLYRYTPFAYKKCREWSQRPEEFVKGGSVRTDGVPGRE